MEPSAANFLRLAGTLLAGALIVLPAAWGAVALWYQAPGGHALKILSVLLWAALSLGLVAWMSQGRTVLSLAAFALAFAALLLWWHLIAPTNDRIWADDVARLATGSIEGNQVTLQNVRNFDWRSDDDYTQRWETRSYHLDHLESVDMIMSYWRGPAIAHMLISFGFDDGAHVVFSVEVRRGKGEGAFSEVGGFFKQFQVAIIAADEDDIIRVRTNIRGEDDYLYRIRMPRADMRALFVGYVNQANGLITTPRFYNTITANCTTLVYYMMKRIVGYLPFDYRVVFTGYLPEYVYKVGGLDRRYPLAVLRERGRITERAKRSDRSPSFSADIRQGIPALPPAE
jgi:hypothetical protein